MDARAITDYVLCARRGDSAAIAGLYLYLRQHLLPRLGAYRQRTLDPEDLLTEVMLRRWRNLDRLRQPGKLLAYARQIARTIAYDSLRRQQRDVEALARYRQRLMTPHVASASLEADELLQLLIAALNPQEAELFRQLYVVGASDREIQATMCISYNLLRLRRHRLHRKLRLVVLRWQQVA